MQTGVETKSESHVKRFKIQKLVRRGGWYSVMAQTPSEGAETVWVEITAFSHKSDAERYCEFLNSAVTNFFNT